MPEFNEEEFLSSLERFKEIERYYLIGRYLNLFLTDGTKYLCDRLQCEWLFGIISDAQEIEEIKNNRFLLWRVQVGSDKSRLLKAVTYPEGLEKVLYQHKLHYTKFPLNNFEFYQRHNICTPAPAPGRVFRG